MSSYSNLDRESFEKFLANAFAVQQSQMDSQSLTAIVEVQRWITRGDLDVDEALHLVVDRAQNVANATGVAIGLLKGDQLVYRAGSGTAAIYIGRSVTATLAVSADSKAHREILRVENAETDARIEAAICRQFGAKSLLILLICHDHTVAGVLEVFFSEAHAFQDREVRTYRLMAGLIGEAMSHAAQLEQKKTLKAELPTTLHAMEPITPQREKFRNEGGSMPGSANKRAIFQPCGAATEVAGELSLLRQPAMLATMIMQRAKRVPWQTRRWNAALGGVVTVLMIACWIAYSYRRPASPLGSSALQRSIAMEQQVPFLPAKAVSAKRTSRLQTAPVLVKEARGARAAFQRVRVGENEVAYIGEDVTVRYFKRKPAVGPPTRPVGSAVQPVAPSWSVPAKSVSSKPAK